MTAPIVLYRGPSQLDGAPIVCIATLGSTNVKTGPMVQTWIMRADVPPLEASNTKADSSVCGDCPRRHSLGGDCYVTLVQAPRGVWTHWDKHGRPGANWSSEEHVRKLTKAAQDHGFRMGSYGDPMAVPVYVWERALSQLQPKLWTGYTHQWRRQWDAVTRGWFALHIMASCDSIADAETARERGWRYFLAVSPDQVPNVPRRTVLCLAERDTNPRTCETCGICNGGAETKASVYLVEHGARSGAKHRRSGKLVVVQ